MIYLKREADKIFFDNYIKRNDESFDENAKMPGSFLGEGAYHTALKNRKVHEPEF